MASWNDFFGTNNNNNNGLPEWMNMPSDSVAAQVIRYPARPYHDRYALSTVDRRPLITMELKVPICCEGCEERVLSRLIDIEGVQSVKCDQLKQKVTVSGTASPSEVLNACKKLFKRSKWWNS
ncbi:unnamed protein product [Calypogeia fissa]